MKTMTSESESSELLNADEILVVQACDDLDPDFIIEAAGGPIDVGGGPNTGPNSPPC